MKKCLSIAGSDCSGCAGIQADIKTFSALGTFGMSVITSVVAENTSRVLSVCKIPTDEIRKQIDAVFEDIEVSAVKLGMLPDADIVNTVADALAYYKPPFVVCDPVMVATSGDALCESSMNDAVIKRLFPLVDLITPNIPETEVISGVRIGSAADFRKAADVILGMGVKALLIKGGHLDESDKLVNILYTKDSEYVINSERIDSVNTHGTGCTLSSAIAAYTANGKSLEDSCRMGCEYVSEAIRNSFYTGKGHGPVNHFHEYYNIKGVK